MDFEILNKILEDAHKVYDEISKNNNVLDGLLNVDCTNYKNIQIEQIDYTRNTFLENITRFIESLDDMNFTDINPDSISQLTDILSSDNLEIFKLKNLLSSELNEYIFKIERGMYRYVFEILNENNRYNKIDFFAELYKDINVVNFLNIIKNIEKDQLIIVDTVVEDKVDAVVDDKVDAVVVDKVDAVVAVIDDKVLENLVNELANLFDLEHNLLDEMDYTFWHQDIQLYEFKNKKTYNYLYLYFDLFKREDKTETLNLIRLDTKNKKVCICYNFSDKISESEFEKLKENIVDIIENI